MSLPKSGAPAATQAQVSTAQSGNGPLSPYIWVEHTPKHKDRPRKASDGTLYHRQQKLPKHKKLNIALFQATIANYAVAANQPGGVSWTPKAAQRLDNESSVNTRAAIRQKAEAVSLYCCHLLQATGVAIIAPPHDFTDNRTSWTHSPHITIAIGDHVYHPTYQDDNRKGEDEGRGGVWLSHLSLVVNNEMQYLKKV